jgi:hypothetical protein
MQVLAIWSHIAETSIEAEASIHSYSYVQYDTPKARHVTLRIEDSLKGIPEIRILDIGQIVKSMRVGIDYSPIRLSLGGDLSLVPPDQQYPGPQDDADKARVEAQVNIE